jgi:hypothetical protein
MINISDEIKAKYLKDSQPKELVIDCSHKDSTDLLNVNVGLPADLSVYSGGILDEYRIAYRSSQFIIYLFSRARGYDIATVNNAKVLSVNFKFSAFSITTGTLLDNPYWYVYYYDMNGNSVTYRHYIEDASIYDTTSPIDVSFEVPLPNGISRFDTIALKCISEVPPPSVSNTWTIPVKHGDYKLYYGAGNDYCVNNLVNLKDTNFNPDDYTAHRIFEDNIAEESLEITESLSSQDNLKYGLCEASICEFDVVNYSGIEVGDYIYPKISLEGVQNSEIPLGEYIVHSIATSYEGRLEKKHITAYDRITKLGGRATNWNTVYMYGVNTYNEDGQYTGRGFEYARQLYSSVFSALKFFGVDDIRKYHVEVISQIESVNSNMWLEWDDPNSDNKYKLYWAEWTLTDPDTSARYFVDYRNVMESGVALTDKQVVATYMPHYTDEVDSLGRGFGKGDILVEETLSGGYKHRFLADRGDAFMLSSNCTEVMIRYPFVCKYVKPNDVPLDTWALISASHLYKITDPIELTNGAERLMYYNYGNRTIFPIDTSATGRDVVRSILEVCGCLFSLNRENGTPKYLYAKKAGLYPSNTLYPSDELYPRAGTSEVYPMARYWELKAEDYDVESIGVIQIVKKDETNDTASCVWEYRGSSAKSAYLIEDNIYYCSNEMVYDYDLMGEVTSVLEDMFNHITNTHYTPYKASLIGLPWTEAGDRIALLTHTGGFETFIFRRKIKGIDFLKDTYEAKGNKLVRPVNTYTYSEED